MLTKRKMLIALLLISLIGSSFGFLSQGEYSYGINEDFFNTSTAAPEYADQVRELIVNTPENLLAKGYEEHIDYLEDRGFVLQNPMGEVNGTSADFQEDLVKKIGYTYLFAFDEGYEDWETAKTELKERFTDLEISIHFIEGNHRVAMFGTGERTLHTSQHWHYDMIHLQEAWGIHQGSPEVKVAVLDTGVDYRHSGLVDHIDPELGKNFVEGENSEDPMDLNGHGTHVAGIIGGYGHTAGVMESVTIIPVKVLNDEGNGSNFWIYYGILHALEQGADVINFSFGSEHYSQLIEGAVKLAEENNVIMVAAVGNNGTEGLQYPAAFAEVLSVGSLNYDGERSVFSNYGGKLDFMAPGEQIYSTMLRDTYSLRSGTSMAAPHLAGVVGLMRSLQPDISIEEVREILGNTAKIEEDQSPLYYGKGIINAYRALETVVMENNINLYPESERISGSSRYWTAYEVAMKKYGEQGVETIIIVRGDGPAASPNVVDGLTASALAGVESAPIFLTPNSQLDDAVVQGIMDLQPKRAIIVGGNNAVDESVEAQLKQIGLVTERIYKEKGSRYDTAAMVSERVLEQRTGNTAIIAGGHALADALVAGPLAHEKGFPILLVSREIPVQTEKLIQDHNIKNLIIIGGDKAVSPEAEEALSKLVTGDVIRLAGDETVGKNRYGTSINVYRKDPLGNEEVALVNGNSFVDAVSVSALGKPILYVQKDVASPEVQEIVLTKQGFFVIGGFKVISREMILESF